MAIFSKQNIANSDVNEWDLSLIICENTIPIQSGTFNLFIKQYFLKQYTM